MRKMFMCTLVVFGFMNFCFGQVNTTIERLTIKTYDTDGQTEQLRLRGNEAVSFDIPAYITENEHLDRIVINGTFRTNFLTTNIAYDSHDHENTDGEFICEDVTSELTPFLGVWGPMGKNANGVRVDAVIPTTGAALAGITKDEVITNLNDKEINGFSDLKAAVLSSKIGDRVELKLKNDSEVYSKYAIIGSRGIETVNYKYCDVKPSDIGNEKLTNSNAPSSYLRSYPNPTSSTTNIEYSSVSDLDVKLSVTDIAGRLVHTEVINGFTGNINLNYDLSDELSGTYIITIQQGEEKHTSKVLLIKE